MNHRTLNILVFEHDDIRFQFLESLSKNATIFEIHLQRCATFHLAQKALETEMYDMCIVNFESDGIALLKSVRQYTHDLPCMVSAKFVDRYVMEQMRSLGFVSALPLHLLSVGEFEDYLAKTYYGFISAKESIEHEYHLRMALKAAKMVTWDWDVPKDELRYTNETSTVMTGRNGYGLRHTFKTFLQYVHPEDRVQVDESIQNALKSGDDYDYEYRLYWANGRVRWARALAKVFRDAEGKAIRMTGVVMDITDQKEAELKIVRLNQNLEDRVKKRTADLEASNKELEAFAYSVSHDLRVPLQGIYGFIEILLQSKIDEQTERYILRIRRNAERMSALIDDLLALSRVTRLKLNYDKVNLTDLATRILKNCQQNDRNREVQLEIEQTPFAFGDERLIRVALENLLYNAWKYTGRTEHAYIRFGAIEWENATVYFIQDNGAGFDMARAEKLFQPFQRLHTEREFTGTGVGLATVSRVFTRHGGSVWASATVNEGATFCFCLDAVILNTKGAIAQIQATAPFELESV